MCTDYHFCVSLLYFQLILPKTNPGREVDYSLSSKYCTLFCEQQLFGSDVVPIEAMEVNEALMLGFSSDF